MRAVLGETGKLLAAHLNLFTLISLTVWLPGHVVRNYFEFFGPPDIGPAQSFQTMLLIHLLFDPLVVSATVAALGRIKLGLPVSYASAMMEGLAAWGRLLVTRFVIDLGVALPVFAALLAAPAGGVAAVAAGALFLVVAVLIVVVLVRVAVVDSVVVLERATALNAWGRAAARTAGQRGAIFTTLLVLFLAVLSLAFVAALAFRAAPDLNHFVPRVLFDCAAAVSQSLVTIALFVFYWRARVREGALTPGALTPR